MIDTEQFFTEQLSKWQEVKGRYDDLSNVKKKIISLGNIDYIVTFNPAREISTNAKIDKKTIENRPCFLCKKNRSKVQNSLDLLDDFEFLVNPFPISKQHFTIVHKYHTPQSIQLTFSSFIEFVELVPHLVFFYNGAKCGASAPDHMHFQAVEKDFLPLQKEWRNFVKKEAVFNENSKIYKLNFGYPLLLIESANKEELNKNFERIYTAFSKKREEPNWNILGWKENEKTIICIILREKHRPNYFFEKEDKRLIVSPATIDLAGVLVTVREKDFEKTDKNILLEILSEVCLSDSEFEKKWKKIAEK